MKKLVANLNKMGLIMVSIAAALFILALLPFDFLKILSNALSPDHNFSFLTSETVLLFRVLFVMSGLILLALVYGMRFWIRIYAFLLALLYGIIFSGQVLGFFQLYRPLLVFPLTLVTTVVIYWLYCKYWFPDFYSSFGTDEPKEKPFSLDHVFLISGLVLMVLLILVPVIIWPYSPVNSVLNFDVGKYHWPKALELANTGSAWDMTISYAAYPYGYESLFSFAALLTRNGILFGTVQAIGDFFFLMTLWLLMRRYTRLPVGMLLFLTVILSISGALWRVGNPWKIYQSLLFIIGKNDLFLGAGILAVILHAPIGHPDDHDAWHPLGMGITGMIAFSTKPNAFLIIVPLCVIASYIGLYRSNKEKMSRTRIIAIVAGFAALIIPSLLWILRNWIAQGFIFGPGELRLEKLSILYNLTNPNFYLGIPFELYFLAGIFISSFLLVIFHRGITWRAWILFGVLVVGFISTPATAFVHNLQESPYISWRFGVAVLTFMLLVLLLAAAAWIKRFYSYLLHRNNLGFVVSLVIVVPTLWYVWNSRLTFMPNLQNAIVLEDQYATSVGVNGYHSAFDYIHKNVKNSVIQVVNGLPFYAYGPGFTNSTTLSRPAEYLVVLDTEWGKHCSTAYCAKPADKSMYADWLLVYEDSQGQVYRRP